MFILACWSQYQPAIHAQVIQEIPIRNTVLRRWRKSNGKMTNLSLFLVACSNVSNNCFVFFFWLLNNRFIMVLASAYDQKCSVRTLVLKTDVTLVQTLRLIILDLSRDMTKPTKWVWAKRRLRSAWASALSDQSLRCPHEESWGP